MQPQINAIKQLLETNNAIASQIEEILIKALGQQAAWENCSTMSELTELEDRFDDQEEIPNEFRWIWELLWRSRVDLNDARINAEEVDLEAFLACLLEEQKQSKVSLSSCLKSDEVIAERDREIERLKLRIDELEWINEPSPIASNLEALENVVDKAVNPRLLQKIEERDRQIKQLEEQNEAIAKQLVAAERRVVYLTESNSADLAHIKKANSALEFLRRVYDEGGAIVPSRFCSSLEIILAKNDGRFFADKHAEYDEDAICEYVLRTEKLRSLSDLSLQRVRDLSLIQGVTPEEYLSLEIPESDRYVEINGVKINTELAFRDLIKLRDREIENLKLALDAAKKPTDDLQMECDQLRRDLRERDRQIEDLQSELALQKAHAECFAKSSIENIRDVAEITNHHNEFVQSLKDALRGYRLVEEPDILDTIAHITTDYIAMVDELKKTNEIDRQIQELEITNKNNREQFDNLKTRFEVLLRAINMNLNALKGERKPDRVETVDGVEIRYRRYDDNLTHRQKTILVEAYQVAIAEEAKKLKGINLKDFSFDDIPF